MEGLPPNRDQATSLRTLRDRARRLETIELERQPDHWRNPHMEGEVHFEYAKEPSSTFHMGHGEYEFAFKVSGAGGDSVYVYSDPIQAVGLAQTEDRSVIDLTARLSSGRSVTAHAGDSVVLMNSHGALCRARIQGVQAEKNSHPYVTPHVSFRYEVKVEPGE